MAISEAQLDTWAKQGSITQSKATYATVRTCLEASDAPYAGRSKSIFLQGSYGNDTNIYADSDVDVVIATDSIYYYGTDDLTPDEVTAFKASLIGGGGYTYDKFKAEVLAQLTKKFGGSVKPGEKAIFVKGDGSRRDADILPAVEYRRYTRCLVPEFDGVLSMQEWKDALWARFYTGAPARQRQSVEQYKIVKKA